MGKAVYSCPVDSVTYTTLGNTISLKSFHFLYGSLPEKRPLSMAVIPCPQVAFVLNSRTEEM